VAPCTTITHWSLIRSWALILKETCPQASCVLSSTIIDSHQETVWGQACNPPDSH
jgi:hypothetical protein